MTTSVHAALAKRFAPPEWACLFEVRSAAGFDAWRIADCVAMNVWPSRGLEIHGIEVKTARGDWLRELAQPEKSAPVQRHCDRWWVAVSSPDIVRDGELPPTWGLLVLRGDKLVQKVEAPKLDAEPVTRTFLASLLRNITDQMARMVPKSDVDARVVAEWDALQKSTAESGKQMEQIYREQVDELRERIATFEKHSGVRIDEYGPDQIGDAVRFVRSHRAAVESAFERTAERLRGVLSMVERAHAETAAMFVDASETVEEASCPRT